MDGTNLATESSFNDIQHIVQLYVAQLSEGCGVWSCENKICDTGRRNTQPPQRPIRKYSPRSARTIALAIASGPAPRKHLCSNLRRGDQQSRESSFNNSEPETPRDASDLTQLLSDTKSVRQFFAGSKTANVRPVQNEGLLIQLERLLVSETLSSGEVDRDGSLSSEAPSSIIVQAVDAIVEDMPKATRAQYEFADSIIRQGCSYPAVNGSTPTDPKWNCWLHILDLMDQQSKLRLLVGVCKVFAIMTNRYLGHKACDENGQQSTDAANKRISIHDGLLDYLKDHTGSILVLGPMCKKMFLSHWDHISTTVPTKSITCGALEILELLHNNFADYKGFFDTHVAAQSLEIVDLAQSWKQAANSSKTRHLLSFDFLFPAHSRAMCFRMISHLKMREAVSFVEQAAALRRRMMPHMLDDEPEGRLKHLEQQYLLLNVSRVDVLRDAYNQLWQRRQRELFRPLRVRLGEVDELEVGHDLGGVQMEFFNLVCQEAMKEESGMFTTDVQSGLTYFRPGSLQPLYMFELLGLLMALAIYNGITLPISFPKAFYKILTEGAPKRPSDDGGRGGAAPLQNLRDAWAAEARSLESLLKEDVSDLEYSFPLDANGLRLAVHFQKGVSSSPILSSVTDEKGRSVETMPMLTWPGWKLLQPPQDPGIVTAQNKSRYVSEYAWWLTWASVKPQWKAFMSGFHRVIDQRTLSIFKPADLKAFVEGSSRLDIGELRKSTQYEGYEARSKYIQNFWRLVSSWPEEKQKKLLKFVTAAERIPIGGASQLTFVIKKTVVEDLEHLPTSSTCFGTLYLPRYASSEALNEKLSLAIEYGLEGFGTG
ncbi:hypothetical protein BTJ68_06167 [Hortaea werneckii EXF-2000]|uniref:HECT-type E3 ubiquitin transferase n=1 Tax=Hortaea werneckii EXF-2000 TaxID=1157616 RepID=A0A1Z5TB62_HORWE|nr:hypothetical protein BTJ68_06167 [Hortaea werneckii EXF-2000]